MPNEQHYPTDEITRAAADTLRATGVPAADAELVADALVSADRRGIYSHGLLRLPLYVAALEAGGMNPTPRLRWRVEHGAVAVLQADSAMGQVSMAAAVDRAAALAEEFGIGMVAVEGSTHYGAGNYWSDRLTSRGLIGIVTSTTGPVVAPYGGAISVIGTNPLTIGAPSAAGHALTADLATSAGAYGKVLAARNAGAFIPEGWAVDPHGRPTTDPAEAIAGSLVAFGGHKGSAIAVLLEALSASLTDANYAAETVDIWSTPSSVMNTGHTVIAIDPNAFLGRDHTAARVATLQDRVRGSGHGALAPGDPEADKAQGAAESIPLAAVTVAALDELWRRLGVTAPTPIAE